MTYNFSGLDMNAPVTPQFNFGGATGASPTGTFNLNMPNNMSGFSNLMDSYTPEFDPAGPAAAGFKFGANIPTFQLGLMGLNTIGNLWGAHQANKLARDQLNFTKTIGNANLNNQIKSYNTALAGRARSRAVVEGQSPEETQAYIAANQLSR